jgi:DNA-binding response OmpR family regulator
VDDDPYVTMKLKTVLYEIGFRVNSFNYPILALKNFHAGSYDLLIIDIYDKTSDEIAPCGICSLWEPNKEEMH